MQDLMQALKIEMEEEKKADFTTVNINGKKYNIEAKMVEDMKT